MRGPTHVTAGIASWLTFGELAYTAHDAPSFAIMLSGCLAAATGALLPDIDQRWPWSRITGGHRHATHSLIGLVAAAGCFAALAALVHLPWLIVAAFTFGYLSHIATDSMTIRGCPWLWPNLTRFWLLPAGWRVTTGGKRMYHQGLRMNVRQPAYGEAVVAISFVVVATAGAYWSIFR